MTQHWACRARSGFRWVAMVLGVLGLLETVKSAQSTPAYLEIGNYNDDACETIGSVIDSLPQIDPTQPMMVGIGGSSKSMRIIDDQLRGCSDAPFAFFQIYSKQASEEVPTCVLSREFTDFMIVNNQVHILTDVAVLKFN